MKATLELALEALESCGSGHITDGGSQWYDEKLVDNSITAIKEALSSPNGEAQPEPSPEWMTEEEQTAYTFGWFKALESQRTAAVGEDTRRAWVGLTDEEIDELFEYGLAFERPRVIYREIEAKLKAKNERLEKNT